MAGFEINYEGIKQLATDPAGPVGRILEHKALNVESIMKTLLLIPGSGRLYDQYVFTRIKGAPKGTPGRLGFYGSRPPHVASAPGMPPASDTGNLLASIGHKLVVEEESVVARVVADRFYALLLEHGTRYMDPRPFMKPALEAGVKLP